jgi:hypothetical protein
MEKLVSENETTLAAKALLLDALVYSVATSPNAKAADTRISEFYPEYKTEDKFEFLKENFNFQIACGSEGTESIHKYYSLAIQFILSEARDFGVKSIIKTKNKTEGS